MSVMEREREVSRCMRERVWKDWEASEREKDHEVCKREREKKKEGRIAGHAKETCVHIYYIVLSILSFFFHFIGLQCD